MTSTTTPKTLKHHWRASKWMQGFSCSTCGAHSYDRNDEPCLVARHADPEINKLYRERRKAAEAADGSGYTASKGWVSLESIEAQLRKVDPDGDWRREGNLLDGRGWHLT